MVAYFMPYAAWSDNFKTILIGLASVAHAAVFLAMQRDGYLSAHFYVLVSMFTVAAAGVVTQGLMQRCGLSCCPIPTHWRLQDEAEREAKMEKQRKIRSLDGKGKGDADDLGRMNKVRIETPNSSEQGCGNRNSKGSHGNSSTREPLPPLSSPSQCVSHNDVQAGVRSPITAVGLADSSNVSSDAYASHWKVAGAAAASAASADAPTPFAETMLQLIAQEEIRLQTEAKEQARAILRVTSKQACNLPPPMLQLLAQLLMQVQEELAVSAGDDAAGVSDASYTPFSESQWSVLVQEALSRYQAACESYMQSVRNNGWTAAAAAAASSGDSVQCAGDEPFEMDGTLLIKHVQMQLQLWTETLANLAVLPEGAAASSTAPAPPRPARPASAQAICEAAAHVLFVKMDDVAASDGGGVTAESIHFVVRELSSIDSLAEMVLHFDNELVAMRQLLELADSKQVEHVEAVEQRQAERVVAEECAQEQPSEVERMLSEVAQHAAEVSDGSVEGEVMLPPGMVLADPDGMHALAKAMSPQRCALKALKSSAAAIVAARRAAAEAADDDSLCAHFERLYRTLVSDEVQVDAACTVQRNAADHALVDKLSRGKSSKEQRLLRSALRDDALLEVFRIEEQEKQQRVLDTRIRLRDEKKARDAADRRKLAVAHVISAQKEAAKPKGDAAATAAAAAAPVASVVPASVSPPSVVVSSLLPLARRGSLPLLPLQGRLAPLTGVVAGVLAAPKPMLTSRSVNQTARHEKR
jgi:hypothetical protein